MRRRRRRVLTPDLVDQPLDGNDLVRAKQERREHGKLLAASESKRRPADLGSHRTEDVETDRVSLTRLARS
jgi:hypothetical protein